MIGPLPLLHAFKYGINVYESDVTDGHSYITLVTPVTEVTGNGGDLFNTIPPVLSHPELAVLPLHLYQQ